MVSIILVCLTGCQKKVYLMPTPVLWTTGEHDPFQANPVLEESNRVPVYYATNRFPLGQDDMVAYTIFGDRDLRLGVADFRIGQDVNWDLIYSLSTSWDENDRPVLLLDEIKEFAKIQEDGSYTALPQAVLDFFEGINTALSESLDKDIMIYVHGANSSVYRASAQAAQYRHFTGRNSVVIAFLWPSAESLLKYETDVRHAAKTAPVFANFIELLSRHTNARNINILSYSAGAQIVSPALQQLAMRSTDELNLGELYFAAPDLDYTAFIDDIWDYIDRVKSITLALNRKDRVLAYAEGHHKKARLGLPRSKELNGEQKQLATSITWMPKFTVLLVDSEFMPLKNPRTHDFWYTHPWVSSDVLIQFLLHAGPAERGLQKFETEEGVEFWSFPVDYSERIASTVRKLLYEELQKQ